MMRRPGRLRCIFFSRPSNRSVAVLRSCASSTITTLHNQASYPAGLWYAQPCLMQQTVPVCAQQGIVHHLPQQHAVCAVLDLRSTLLAQPVSLSNRLQPNDSSRQSGLTGEQTSSKRIA